MKKFAALTALVLVLSTVLCACGKNNKNGTTDKHTSVSSGDKITAASSTDFKKVAENALKDYKATVTGTHNPVAALVLKDGSVVLMELYPDVAPNTVNNFISLANKGFYDGLIFHRIIENFMVQGGDPLGTGRGDPGYSITGEFSNNNIKNDIKFEKGVLAMARAGSQVNPELYYNTAGSQFFICVGDCSWLNNDYAAFGKVISGMDYIMQLSHTQTDKNDMPLETQYMECIRVETFDKQYDEPITLAD